MIDVHDRCPWQCPWCMSKTMSTTDGDTPKKRPPRAEPSCWNGLTHPLMMNLAPLRLTNDGCTDSINSCFFPAILVLLSLSTTTATLTAITAVEMLYKVDMSRVCIVLTRYISPALMMPRRCLGVLHTTSPPPSTNHPPPTVIFWSYYFDFLQSIPQTYYPCTGIFNIIVVTTGVFCARNFVWMLINNRHHKYTRSHGYFSPPPPVFKNSCTIHTTPYVVYGTYNFTVFFCYAIYIPSIYIQSTPAVVSVFTFSQCFS